jgi:DNA polymerase
MSASSQQAAVEAQWDALGRRIRGCIACPELARTRTQAVVGEAPASARLVFVGEAPGASEDEQGRPFVGRAGQVLDAALVAAGLDRSRVAVANVLKCRPPGNRRPLPGEVDNCRHWLTAQLEILAPSLVVPLGLTAIGWFLAPTGRNRLVLRDVRGRVHDALGYRVLPTYHPSGALRYGPAGAPMQALYADVALAAQLSAA